MASVSSTFIDRPRGRVAVSIPFSTIAAYAAFALSFGFAGALVLGLVP